MQLCPQQFNASYLGAPIRLAHSSAQLVARQAMPRKLPNISGDPQNLARLQRYRPGHILCRFRKKPSLDARIGASCYGNLTGVVRNVRGAHLNILSETAQHSITEIGEYAVDHRARNGCMKLGGLHVYRTTNRSSTQPYASSLTS